MIPDENKTPTDLTAFIPSVPSVHTTADAAEKLGISQETIRGLKKRYPERLIEHTHWGKDPQDGSLWWTEFGLAELSQLSPKAKSYTPNIDPRLALQRPAFNSETDCVAAPETPDISHDDAILCQLATPLAVERLQHRLASKVDAEYERLITALEHLFQHPEQTPDPGIERLLEMVGVSMSAARMANAFAGFNTDAKQIVSEARAMLREGE